MKIIHPNNDDTEKHSSQLNEGEEISLGLEPKQELEHSSVEHSKPGEENYYKITKINHNRITDESNIAPHAQGDLSTRAQLEIQDNTAEHYELSNYPKIDLKPDESEDRPDNSNQKKTTRQKLSEIRKHKHWHNAKLVVGTVLVFLLIFNSQWFISQFMFLFNRPKAQTTTEQAQDKNQQASKNTEAEVVGPQNEIIIPKIGVTAPLVFINTTNEADVLFALRDGIVHYYGTALPGEVGNSVFFGHSSNDWWEPGNYKFVFVLLEKLAVGDTYEIHYNSRKYVYKVSETKIVAPNDLSVLNQTSEPTSTLITCTPPGTSWQRFVVVGKQISPVFNTSTSQSEQKTANNKTSTSSTLPSAPPSLWQQITDFFSGLTGGRDNKDSSNQQPTEVKRLPEIN